MLEILELRAEDPLMPLAAAPLLELLQARTQKRKTHLKVENDFCPRAPSLKMSVSWGSFLAWIVSCRDRQAKLAVRRVRVARQPLRIHLSKRLRRVPQSLQMWKQKTTWRQNLPYEDLTDQSLTRPLNAMILSPTSMVVVPRIMRIIFLLVLALTPIWAKKPLTAPVVYITVLLQAVLFRLFIVFRPQYHLCPPLWTTRTTTVD